MDDGDLNCSPYALANAEPVREVSRRDFLSLVLDSSSDLSGKPVDHNLSKSFQVEMPVGHNDLVKWISGVDDRMHSML